MDGFFNGFLTAAVPMLAAVVAQYLLIRKSRRDDKEQQVVLTEKQRVARVKEKREDEKTARDEYRELYEEHKAELAECRRDHRRAERRIARLEGIMIVRGFPMPEIPDDGTDEHPTITGKTPTEGI